MSHAESASIRIEPGITKHLANVLIKVLLDLVPVLLDSLPGQFLTRADGPVNGAEHPVIGFRLVPELFDKELRATLRAKGLEIPDNLRIVQGSFSNEGRPSQSA